MAASLDEELSAKLEKNPCEDVRALWEGNEALPAAVERLRPIFGRR